MHLASLCGAMSLLSIDIAVAGSIEVRVIGPDGAPVPGVAVFTTGGDIQPPPAESAVMDQVDTQFDPHVLVIQRGTSVEFPNSDVVAHHVYSFSKPNDFVLPLYKGDPHDPVTFKHDGVVTLGCNIHDQMLAYIVVVESDDYGITDAEGRLTLELDGDETAVSIWSPRIRDHEVGLTRELTGLSSPLVFELQRKLLPPHDAGAGAIQWSDY